MFTLEQVVPWGRSFDEYRGMFALSTGDLALRILGCGDGPASFNAEATRRGMTVTSCDPIYRWEAVQIRERIVATYDQIIDQTRRNSDEFVWSSIRSIDELGLGGQRSVYVDRGVADLRASGHDVSIESVPYEFQRGGNQMVRIRTVMPDRIEQ